MSSIERRIKQAEERLGVDDPPAVIQIVLFGGGPLPPDERRGNVIVRHVFYESIRERWKGQAEHENRIEDRACGTADGLGAERPSVDRGAPGGPVADEAAYEARLRQRVEQAIRQHPNDAFRLLL
jgi:hypothetical protein